MANRNRNNLYKVALRVLCEKLAAYRGTGWECYYCGCDLDEYGLPNYNLTKPTIDHITPVSQGGTDEIENFVLSCARCNSGRGVKDFDRFKEVTIPLLYRSWDRRKNE